MAAHDLDAPLRKLGVLIEKVAAECQQERRDNVEAYMKRINRCLGDMRSLIDSLTILSRAGIGPGTITEFGLDTVVQEAWRELQPAADDKEAQLTVEPLPVVKADRIQYRQLFKHLLQNAIIFGKKEVVPQITVKAEMLTGAEKENWLEGREGSDHYKITVEDNGIGFRPEYAERIFRPFVRLHGKSEYEGNGIGLALCRKIAENHRGVIYAEGQEDAGARFVLIISQTSN